MSSNKIISVDQWGTQKWTSMENAFTNCDNLSILATDTPDLNLATSMTQIFKFATNLTLATNGNWNWDTSNITDMSEAFRGAKFFNADISSGILQM